MDEKLKSLQGKLDTVISPNEYFTNKDKQRIRSEIGRMKSDAATKRVNLMPKLLTAISASVFFLVIGGLTVNELGFFSSGEQTEQPQDHNPLVTVPLNENEEKPKVGNVEDFIKNSYIIKTGHELVRYPDIKGRTVIWSGSNFLPDSGSSNFDLITYNLQMERFGETFQSKLNGEMSNGQINDDWITWVDTVTKSDTYGWRIYGLNRETKERVLIRDSKDVAGYHNPHIVDPRISMSSRSNMMTWVEPMEGEDKVLIQLFNLDTLELETVGEATTFQVTPQLSDRYLVWSNGEFEFAIYSLEERKVDSNINKNEMFFPKVNNEYIVWQEATDTSDTRLVVKPIQYFEEIELFRGDINSFDIGDGYIIWESSQTIYAYSLRWNEIAIIGENGDFPIIRENVAMWQLSKEGEKDSVFQVVSLRTGDVSKFVHKDKIIEVESFGQREKGIEADINALISGKELFQSKLEDSLNGVYLNEKGAVVVDFKHFGKIIGVPSHEERGALITALNEVIFKHTKTKKIYYTFEGNFTSFGDWTEAGEYVYKRD